MTAMTWHVAVLAVSILVAGPGSPTANAAGLNDYLWKSRPLLIFAPASTDPRLVETRKQVDAARCDFTSRDMVLGVIVAQADSSLDGRAVDPRESQGLRDRYAVGADAFATVLIGKDGTEKKRSSDVPDLASIFALVDGMPMRSRDTGGESARC